MADHKRPGKQQDYSPKMRSNSSVFAKRGDPWTTDKEGSRNYGRNLESENPDFDQYFAKRASTDDRPTVGGVAVTSAKPERPKQRDAALIRAQKLSALRRKMKP